MYLHQLSQCPDVPQLTIRSLFNRCNQFVSPFAGHRSPRADRSSRVDGRCRNAAALGRKQASRLRKPPREEQRQSGRNGVVEISLLDQFIIIYPDRFCRKCAIGNGSSPTPAVHRDVKRNIFGGQLFGNRVLYNLHSTHIR